MCPSFLRMWQTATLHAGRSVRSRSAALLCLVPLLAVACSSGVDDTETSGQEPSAPPTAPSGVQELVVGTVADPWVDAEIDRKRLPNYPLNADVCETLVHLGTDFQLEPMLAREWEFAGDNTYRFTLDERARFSDGRPMSAEDVKYSIDYTTQEPAIGNSFLGAQSTTIVDERTVDIKPEQPNLRLVDEINHPTYVVLSPGDDPLNDPDVNCTGPFEVVRYVPEEELVVQRNENYWGEPAKLDKITFKFFPDDTTRVLALQNGEVDLIIDVPKAVLSSVEGLPGVKIETAPVGNNTLIYLARRDAEGSPKLLADPLLRRAVAASMDTESYVNGVLAGNAEEVVTIAPPAVLGDFAEMVEGIDYDPAEAARLLDEAGWTRDGDGVRTKDGKPLELTIIFNRIDIATVEFVQAQLSEVGIAGNIQQLDPGAYRDVLESGAFDLNVTVPNQNNANPAFIMTLQMYSKSVSESAKIIGPGPDTAFDRLIDQTQASADPEEVRRLAAEAMHEAVDIEVAAVNLSGGYRIFAMREGVHGLVPHPSNTNQRWSTVFIAE